MVTGCFCTGLGSRNDDKGPLTTKTICPPLIFKPPFAKDHLSGAVNPTSWSGRRVRARSVGRLQDCAPDPHPMESKCQRLCLSNHRSIKPRFRTSMNHTAKTPLSELPLHHMVCVCVCWCVPMHMWGRFLEFCYPSFTCARCMPGLWARFKYGLLCTP